MTLPYEPIKITPKYQFTLASCDTDSIKIAHKDGREHTPEEINQYVTEINNLLPTAINFAVDGLYQPLMVVKAKNYVYVSKGKIKFKGAALLARSKEPALKEMINAVIDSLLGRDARTPLQIYHQYVREASNITEIKRWAAKKTVTKAVLKHERTTELKLFNVIQGLNMQEGDKFFVYFKPDDTYGLAQNFDGNYNKAKLLKKCFDTMGIFHTLLDVSQFLNFSLKKKNVQEYQEVISANGN